MANTYKEKIKKEAKEIARLKYNKELKELDEETKTKIIEEAEESILETHLEEITNHNKDEDYVTPNDVLIENNRDDNDINTKAWRECYGE